jgi:lipid-A-disaccharide synthase
MQNQGCELIEQTARKAAMGHKVISQLGRFIKLISRIRKYFRNNKVDLLVVCDSPAFNFHIAKIAGKRKVKTVFYVAPQLWAWGAWRIGKLRKLCDKLLCILPFEQQWFAERGVDAEFVGNPMLEDFKSNVQKNTKKYKDYNPQDAKIALLAGSRPAEIESLWEPIQRTALKIRKQFPKARFTTIAVDENTKNILRSLPVMGFRCEYTVGELKETLLESDFAIVASGSVTLQLAGAGCPMVVVYESNKLLWKLLGRWLIRTKHLSLVNILSGKQLVPEFMPYIKSEQQLTDSCIELLRDKEKLKQTSRELTCLASRLAEINSSKRTADILRNLLTDRP